MQVVKKHIRVIIFYSKTKTTPQKKLFDYKNIFFVVFLGNVIGIVAYRYLLIQPISMAEATIFLELINLLFGFIKFWRS
ncbi:MAG: hypothetical protein HN916_14030 [Anaerolineae bacterium]|jgi:hypothetical protein|nr:hypothetical protein [Anaerolineae bacterium]MBT7990993.1 hypothetical protein [Anaerolineae bacterium]